MTDAPYSPYVDRLGLDWDASDPEDVALAEVLDTTLTNLTSYMAAAALLDCDAAVIEGWDDLTYEHLVGSLTAEQLARIVLALILPFASGQADGLVHEFRDVRDPRDFCQPSTEGTRP
ncbi:MAG TPA: hypothetical protein VGD39_09695 [Nocardioides sp.]